jgi:hypothetical protein
MASETFSFPEGTLWLWTATATASAQVMYAQNSRAALTHGWVNMPTMDGSYYDHLTGQRADVSIGALYSPDLTIQRMFNSATAIHMRMNHSSIMGSAGYYFYSGRIDNLELAGSDGSVFKFNMTYHANKWSAYGA